MQIVTSFALGKAGIAPHIGRAIQANLANSEISRIHILSETASRDLSESLSVLQSSKVGILPTDTRPTFNDLVTIVNELLQDKPQEPVAILNGDISFATSEDTARVSSLALELSERRAETILCLTRYDLVDGSPKLTLRTQLDLPNTISADAWVFASRVELQFQAYYSLGQMFCDQFFNHDLIESGIRLYNPCLDCVVLHHEADIKGLEYYRAETSRSASQERLKEHWRRSVAQASGQYYGVVHVTSRSLIGGYDPEPMVVSEKRRKLFVAPHHTLTPGQLRDAAEHCVGLAKQWARDLYLLCASDVQHAHLEMVLTELNYPHAYAIRVRSAAGVACSLLLGLDKHYTNVVLVGQQATMKREEQPDFDTIFVSFAPALLTSTNTGQYRFVRASDLGSHTARFLSACLADNQPLIVGWGRTFQEAKNRDAEWFRGKDITTNQEAG